MSKNKKNIEEEAGVIGKNAENPAEETVKNENSETTEKEEKQKKKGKSEKKDDSAEKTAELEKQLAELNDRFLRTVAEYDNFRKRSQKEKEAIYNDSKSDTVSKIVPVMDNFERAAGAETNPDEYKKGMEMIVKQFSDVLSALGVESFGETGETFDPNIHNGVSHIDDENLGENVIAAVYQKGYKLGDRIIRHAVVVVAN